MIKNFIFKYNFFFSCECNNVAYNNDFSSILQTNNFDFDNYATNSDNLSIPSLTLLHNSSINNASSITSTNSFGTNNQMSTFKSSPPVLHSTNSFSSGYNSYLGSGHASSVNGNNNNNNNSLFDNKNLSECLSQNTKQNYFQSCKGTTNDGYLSNSPILNKNNF